MRPKFVVDERGRKVAVILDLVLYRSLLRRLEDLEDALELDVAIRCDKTFRPYEEVRRGLRLGKADSSLCSE